MYSMASWGTVNQLSLGKQNSSGKLLPSAFGLGQQFPRASPLTKGQQFDCFPWNHGISVYCDWETLLQKKKWIIRLSVLCIFSAMLFYEVIKRAFCCWWIEYMSWHKLEETLKNQGKWWPLTCVNYWFISKRVYISSFLCPLQEILTI